VRRSPLTRPQRVLLLFVCVLVLVDTMFFTALTPLLPHYTHVAHLSKAGAGFLVAGYPLDAPHLHLVPARIGGVQNAQGPNIYETSTVTRQIYEIRAVVKSGNSGGPLLSPQGTVDGVVFAAAVGVSDTGFALTAAEVSADASAGEHLTSPVSTGACD